MQKGLKVTVCGGSGGIGQPLSLLLKQSPIIQELAIYDIAPVTPGVVADLSHMDTNSNVTSHVGLDNLKVCIFIICVIGGNCFQIKYLWIAYHSNTYNIYL